MVFSALHDEAPVLQVNSEFQAFKHIKITAPGEMARATKSLEATLALQPTLILTNSLPCSLDVVVWQVSQLSSPVCRPALYQALDTQSPHPLSILCVGLNALLRD